MIDNLKRKLESYPVLETCLSLSKLVSKLEARSWKLEKYELQVSRASIDTSPGAPGTTLNEENTGPTS